MISKAEAMVKSATTDTEFSKDQIIPVEENKKRIEELSSITPIIKEKRTKSSTEKKEKINTKEVSYLLFKAGKSIEDIASERKMVTTTIETHLSHYVSLGMIDVKQFVSSEKMNNIISVIKSMGTLQFKDIKQSLGDEYSYSEIRFSTAYYENSKK
jgi:uncharacterized protein YpbB